MGSIYIDLLPYLILYELNKIYVWIEFFEHFIIWMKINKILYVTNEKKKRIDNSKSDTEKGRDKTG